MNAIKSYCAHSEKIFRPLILHFNYFSFPKISGKRFLAQNCLQLQYVVEQEDPQTH